jgi:8-oxo-dGTP pyrophosphatase MutT (NUDIX family)
VWYGGGERAVREGIAMIDAAIEQQVNQLSQHYGVPLRRSVNLVSTSAFDPLGKPDRYGEVCMVIRRPNGLLLTARKTFYPPDAYRLLTGGIAHGEPIFDALLRETEEETGLDVHVRRFLAAVEYTLEPRRVLAARRPAAGHPFYTFAFLLDEVGGVLACYDPDERVEDFREVNVDDLPHMADQLERLGEQFDPEIQGRWHDWGHFRSIIHRVVYESLTQQVR